MDEKVKELVEEQQKLIDKLRGTIDGLQKQLGDACTATLRWGKVAAAQRELARKFAEQEVVDSDIIRPMQPPPNSEVTFVLPKLAEGQTSQLHPVYLKDAMRAVILQIHQDIMAGKRIPKEVFEGNDLPIPDVEVTIRDI